MMKTTFPAVQTFLLLVACVAVASAQAQTFGVLHNFTGGASGANPVNGLVMDNAGNFYGSASSGGSFNHGLLFEINASGSESTLHLFSGAGDGISPQGLLLMDTSGNIYGTTELGGAHNNGIVFEMAGSQEEIIYNFGTPPDAARPEAGLVADSAGNLYGTTAYGGAHAKGSVFELSPSSQSGGAWTERVLYSFGATKTDGVTPVGGVALDAAGNVYGTTSAGGTYKDGIVFELVRGSNFTETVLHQFENQNDGAVPYASLVPDGLGNFYGAATKGGSNGGGTVFQLAPSGSSWNFNVIYSVPGWGISGSFRNVVLDGAGNLYATTHCDGSNNAGSVYELSPAGGGTWNYNVLYNFSGGSDGLYSFSNLVLNQGVLYGTTKYGGSKNDGVIFAVTP